METSRCHPCVLSLLCSGEPVSPKGELLYSSGLLFWHPIFFFFLTAAALIIWLWWPSGFDKINIQNSKQVSIEGMYLNIIKAMYNKTTDNIILNGENLKACPLISGIKQWFPLPPLLFNIVLEVLTGAIRQGKKKMHPNWKGRSKIVTICRWHDIIYRKSWRLH